MLASSFLSIAQQVDLKAEVRMRSFTKFLFCALLISQPLLSFAKTATPSTTGAPLAQNAPNSRAGYWVNAGLNEDVFLGIYQNFFKNCQLSIQNLQACIAGVNTILARANAIVKSANYLLLLRMRA